MSSSIRRSSRSSAQSQKYRPIFHSSDEESLPEIDICGDNDSDYEPDSEDDPSSPIEVVPSAPMEEDDIPPSDLQEDTTPLSADEENDPSANEENDPSLNPEHEEVTYLLSSDQRPKKKVRFQLLSSSPELILSLSGGFMITDLIPGHDNKTPMISTENIANVENCHQLRHAQATHVADSQCGGTGILTHFGRADHGTAVAGKSYLSTHYRAFGAPSLFWEWNMRRAGINDPSRWELEHADVLTAKGRPDLAECVLVHSRKYQRLKDLLRRGLGVIKGVIATKRAFLGLEDDHVNEQLKTMAKWVHQQMSFRTDDPKIKQLINVQEDWGAEAEGRKRRAASRPAYFISGYHDGQDGDGNYRPIENLPGSGSSSSQALMRVCWTALIIRYMSGEVGVDSPKAIPGAPRAE
ncbi:hypothetical protein TREMEDRAFT_66418 [Tremella mesenterica DSM 1558]|uniref:uncharacterized protein n=1 Tax=Tremella mesenterica (strain ATCC 24925 / CBS 8224 / DSM 1558 / NBRC 9311 / NRRL Y-6157 / RJB 2259-6 / UBC 559-6) TaxID=578456 RepID=UPI00032C5A5F|nr:uncharacterized protein TREMEDRAFT_66418 [Tremella mesenterica DSM 1558]EIW65588.1 hypothetical protein TREMEDRAFT_66418 [Tremella mesenterica DSM 1558]